MIEFTIKTLDSNNHFFSVEDGITVQELKQKVREQMGIEINLQRLIFCGRVLQDEKLLSEYDVNGKVVHLVQRAPPSHDPRPSAPTSNSMTQSPEGPPTAANVNMQQQIRRLMELAGPPDFILEQQQAMALSPTTGRLEFIRRMIGEIKASLAALRAHADGLENRSTPASSEATVEPMDYDPASGAQNDEPEPTVDELADDSSEVGRIQSARRRSYRAIRALRARHSRPRDLSQLLEELDALQETFAPFRADYISMLRSANNPETPTFTEQERSRAQRTVDMVSDIMHSFAHAYHAVSDINFQVGQHNPRLTSEANVVRHPIPVQAHINVVQANRRPGQAAQQQGPQQPPQPPPPPPQQPQQAARQQAQQLQQAARQQAQQTQQAARQQAQQPQQAARQQAQQPQQAARQQAQQPQQAVRQQAQQPQQPQQPRQPRQPQQQPTAQQPQQPQQPQQMPQHFLLQQQQRQQQPLLQQTHHFLLQQQIPQQQHHCMHHQQQQQQQQRQQQQQQQPPPQQSMFRQQQQQVPQQQVPQQQQQPLQVNINAFGNGNGCGSATQTATHTGGQNNQGIQATSLSGRNTTQPTVNINIQPDPITYQVEIETRVPIAIPLENALLNGLTSAAAVVNNPQEFLGQQGQGANPAGQANRRQVILDVENLFRGLSQSGGVEVVMSMEEIPQSGSLGGSLGGTLGGGATGNNPAGAPGGQQRASNEGGGVYIAPMPWGGPPSTELLHNIVTSVMRQGIVPGPEGVTVHLPHMQAHVTQFQVALPDSSPEMDAPLPGGVLPGAQAAAATQTTPITPITPNTTVPPHEVTPPPVHPNLHLRRAATTPRAQAVSLANLIYDRFLQCDSHHARRRIQRRRDHHLQQIAAQERARTERLASRNFEFLQHRNPRISHEHMAIMMRLLSSAPSQESWLNAFLVAVARNLFMPEPLQPISGETTIIPSEFEHVRILLRNYLQNVLTRSNAAESDAEYADVAEFFVSEFRDFIDRMPTITPMFDDLDPYSSIRALVRDRLPLLVGSIINETNGEAYAIRFYTIFSRLFADMCTLISQLCVNGNNGLRVIYRTFLEVRMRYFDESIHAMVTVLSNECLNAVIPTLDTENTNVQQYLVRRLSHPEILDHDDSESPTRPSAGFIRRRIGGSVPLPGPVARSTPVVRCSSGVRSTQPVRSTASLRSTASGTEARATPEAPPAPKPTFAHASTSTASPPSTRPPSQAVSSSTASQSSATSPSQPELSPQTVKSEPPSPTYTEHSSDQNEHIVPPLALMQHWGEEWVPVFSGDQQAQRAELPEPYSDAYLSGMPSRKRRCVRQARPPTTLDAFMNESVREAVNDRSVTIDNSSIRAAFREHMRVIARQRAATSDDYDPLRYASAARFLNDTRKDNKPVKQDNPEVKKEESE